MSRICNHKRVGIVTNMPGTYDPDPNRGHYSQTCCDNPACLADARSRTGSVTSEPAYFVRDANRAEPVKL